MVVKFHLTKDGPKPCKATKRACKYGEHFGSESEALEAFNNANSVITPTLSKRRLDAKEMLLNRETELLVGKLADMGYRPLLVGGCVRDELLGKVSKDIDIEVYGQNSDGSPLSYNDLYNVFKRDRMFNINEVGASFSVLKVAVGREDFDIALPRTERSTGEGHKEYEMDHDSRMDYSEAASRRDFTINSIAYDPVSKKFIDPYNGRRDLKNKTLRHISDAFSDDPLRCLRAVNFVSRFGFSLDDDTLKLCQDLAPTYSTIARERVEEEFNKMFNKGDFCDRGLSTLYDIGWSKQIKSLSNVSREDFVKGGSIINNVPKYLRKAALNKFLVDRGYSDNATFLSTTISEQRLINNTRDFLDAVDDSSSWGSIVASHRKLKKFNDDVSNADLRATAVALGGHNVGVFDRLPEVPVSAAVSGDWLIKYKGFKQGKDLGMFLKKAQDYQDETGINDPEVIYYDLI